MQVQSKRANSADQAQIFEAIIVGLRKENALF